MTSRIAFRLFLFCLVTCAGMALCVVWLEDRITSPLHFQITATLFVVGLAAFLVWFSCTLNALRALVEKKG